MLGSARLATGLSNFFTLLFGLLLAAACALIGYFFLYPYFNAWLSGGTVMNATSLQTAPSEDTHYTHFDTVFAGDTGYYYETSYMFIPVGQDHFGYVLLDDTTFLITKSGDVLPEIENEDFRVTGTLRNTTAEERSKVIEPLRSELPAEMRSMLNGSKILDMTQAENKGFWIAGAVLCAGIGLWGVALTLRSVGRTFVPATHPIWKQLDRFGQPVDDVMRAIETDRESGSTKIGPLEVSRRWIVRRSIMNFQAMRIQDIVWVYGAAQSSGNSTSYVVRVYDRYGVEIVAAVNRKNLEESVNAVHNLAPWALLGTNKEAERIWKENRDDFIRQVDNRKRELAHQN
jgi:hypothetical protein